MGLARGCLRRIGLNLGIGAPFLLEQYCLALRDREAKMADEGKGFWQTVPGFLTGAAALIGAVTGLMVAMKPLSVSSGPESGMDGHSGDGTHIPHPPPPPPPQRRPMGALQYGVGFNHGDLNANSPLVLTTPQACSDVCYERTDCKAMTYVESNRTCWLKFQVANRVSVANEVSAVRQP